MTQGLWLFGYGSIIWKTGFEYEESRIAHIKGWSRKFWQASTDHRGTPDAPGRVVTLAETPGEDCFGMAFRIAETRRTDTLKELDYREKGGYTQRTVNIWFDDHCVQGLTYIAGPDNPNFLGHAAEEEIATQISRSHGPSGSNKEYILQLARALERHEIEDAHVRQLAAQVERLA